MKTILVAEDDSAIIDALSLILGAEGYEVLTAKNKDQIFEQLEKNPDIILLDIRLSGSDGGEICTEIKQHKKLAQIPVLLMSANPDIESIAKEVGANGYIRKPFEMSQLLFELAGYFFLNS